MGIWAQWTTAGPHGTPIGGLCPQIRLFIGVFPLSLFSFSHSLPRPNHTRSFGGSETPRIGRKGGIWGRGVRRMGGWAQWAADHLR